MNEESKDEEAEAGPEESKSEITQLEKLLKSIVPRAESIFSAHMTPQNLPIG